MYIFFQIFLQPCCLTRRHKSFSPLLHTRTSSLPLILYNLTPSFNSRTQHTISLTTSPTTSYDLLYDILMTYHDSDSDMGILPQSRRPRPLIPAPPYRLFHVSLLSSPCGAHSPAILDPCTLFATVSSSCLEWCSRGATMLHAHSVLSPGQEQLLLWHCR